MIYSSKRDDKSRFVLFTVHLCKCLETILEKQMTGKIYPRSFETCSMRKPDRQPAILIRIVCLASSFQWAICYTDPLIVERILNYGARKRKAFSFMVIVISPASVISPSMQSLAPSLFGVILSILHLAVLIVRSIFGIDMCVPFWY